MMETKTKTLHNIARQLKLPGISGGIDNLLLTAQHKQYSYLDFALELLGSEINHRNQLNLIRRIKSAKLPFNHDLGLWKDTHQNGISKMQLVQLRECLWLEQNFNIVLMGPSGTGKTFIAAGLCDDALQKGYRACFRTMDQLIYLLKMKDITKSAEMEFKTLLKADLLAIDDIMMFPMEKKQAVALFNLVDHFHQGASMIITTNKSPDDWVNVLEDEVLATAILDRLLHRCEIIKLVGKSFRMENRENIFV